MGSSSDNTRQRDGGSRDSNGDIGGARPGEADTSVTPSTRLTSRQGLLREELADRARLLSEGPPGSI
jgi:hypothetical protein